VRLAAEILRIYARVRWLMREDDVRETVTALRSAPPTDGNGDVSVAPLHTAVRLGHAVARTLSPLPTDSRCLARSLVLTRLLARRGIDSTLVIGVRSVPFGAHAWVERDGVPVLPTEGSEFRRLTEL
jgi:hypothetical protein